MAFYCSNCGKPIATDARHCPHCGSAVGGAFQGTRAVPPSASQRRMVRPRMGRVIAGVCQGVAVTYGWDTTLVRVVFVLLACFSGVGLLLYIVLWVAVPEEPLMLPTAASYPPPANPQA
ncbi:MAG TPA: PspC domain-containing protein [Acidobacteriaceae bacterium]|jgi:phage shock protein C